MRNDDDEDDDGGVGDVVVGRVGSGGRVATFLEVERRGIGGGGPSPCCEGDEGVGEEGEGDVALGLPVFWKGI